MITPPRESALPWSLSLLPLAARLTLACFLISVGIGYCSALVQLHFQHASPGELLPTPKDAVRTFHGPIETAQPKSRLEMLITAEESLPWNGSGQMSAAFTTRSEGWKAVIRKRSEEEVRAERYGERDALVAWIQAGADKTAYEQDNFVLPRDQVPEAITEEFAEKTEQGWNVKIKSILEARCVRCHQEGGDDANASNYKLDSYENLSKYLKVEQGGPAMSVEKLAQTTHVHLLAFSMLYMLTGLLLAMTRYPTFLKVPLAITPLLVQIIDIACWWLARLPGDVGVRFAEAIPITGAIVAVGLLMQIILTLFDLFGRWGKLVLVLLLIGAGFGTSLTYSKVIHPYLQAEKQSWKELQGD
ncbi:MAG: hypothetical protein SNJ82_11635 [Gemmataceae bacterium]